MARLLLRWVGRPVKADWFRPPPQGQRSRPGTADRPDRPCRLLAMAGIAVRYERLLEAGLALGAELSLPVALQRIVELAAELTGARYGALGVLGRDGRISEFITTGVTATERAAIGPLPVGRGILGVLIDDPRPLRLHDLADDPRSVGFPARHPPCGRSWASRSRPAAGCTATCT
jgi:GAF domain-containing protein